MRRGKTLAHVIEVFQAQEPITEIKTDKWYEVNLAEIDLDLHALFYPCSVDSETYEFLNASVLVSQNMCLQLFYTITTVLLRAFVTKTTLNGLLERGQMFVFSTDQLSAFLSIDNQWTSENKAMIDLGAGDGQVTLKFQPLFQKIYATEASRIMEWRLKRKGFHVLPKDDWKSRGPFKLISALNLLDRFYDPAQLLADIHEVAKRDNALVLIAIVLPLSQYVEFHPDGRKKTTANSRIFVSGRNFHSHLNTLVKNVFHPAGYELLRWSKVPYLCEGDLHKPFYKLDDALFLLKAKPLPFNSTLTTEIHEADEGVDNDEL